MNLAACILHIYPAAKQDVDFVVQDDSDGRGPYIAIWKLDAPQPTEAELQAAWEAYQAEEAQRPVMPTETEILGMQLVQREIETMQLQAANDMLGMQMVDKDIQLLQVNQEHGVLGQQVVDMEIRMMMGGL